MYNIYAIRDNRIVATENNITDEDLELAVSFLVSLTDCQGITILTADGWVHSQRDITKL